MQVPAVVGRVEVDMLPFDRTPEALDEGVVGGAALLAIAADSAAAASGACPWARLAN